MPATGPRAPARILVAVRAMVPVTGMPPVIAGGDIADALRHQFAVGAMAPSRHAVGDHGGEQRFDRAEDRDRDRIGQHRADLFDAEGRDRGRPACRTGWRRSASRWSRHSGRSSAVSRVAPATAISSAGQFGRSRRISEDGGDRKHRECDGDRVDGADRPPQALSASAPCRPGRSRACSPNRSRDLRDQDDDGDAGGEADRHRIGDVLDIGAEPQKPDDEQQHARPSGSPACRPS